MGILSLDRRIEAEVLDARGGVVLTTGSTRLRAVLREPPEVFVDGARVSLHIPVGGDRFEALCRVIDTGAGWGVTFAPGARVTLEVLRAAPAGISGIEAFDLVPQADRGERVPTASLPPAVAFENDSDEGIDDDDDEPTGVVGTLKEMPLHEIVQSLNHSRKDALVEVKPKGRERGVIGIERGRVVHAHTDSRIGEAAFFELLRARRGVFRIKYGRSAGSTNIDRDTTFLLLEGARLLDEEMCAAPPPAPAFDPATAFASAPDDSAAMDDAPLDPHVPHVHTTTSGLFSRFFDEAGVKTPAPLPVETTRFQSLAVADDLPDLDDADRLDTDRTMRERRRPGPQLSDTPA